MQMSLSLCALRQFSNMFELIAQIYWCRQKINSRCLQRSNGWQWWPHSIDNCVLGHNNKRRRQNDSADDGFLMALTSNQHWQLRNQQNASDGGIIGLNYFWDYTHDPIKFNSLNWIPHQNIILSSNVWWYNNVYSIRFSSIIIACDKSELLHCII